MGVALDQSRGGLTATVGVKGEAKGSEDGAQLISNGAGAIS